jgi:formylglycine-generating enzyme required for sulfatase activity
MIFTLISRTSFLVGLFSTAIVFLPASLGYAQAKKNSAGSGVSKPAADFSSYKQVIPGSKVSFEMVPIPGGEFMMGSPATEGKRKDDEGPQKKVKVDPFWMAKHEVTWDEFELFSSRNMEARALAESGETKKDNPRVDAVSRPTPPYVDMTFGMGKNGFPAISMTHYAALMYCKWLTEKTGVFYRLPTEAEWEYAARAGTTTAYHFGDDPAKLDDYAWSYQNSGTGYRQVGQKLPNPWGLHDMHGNVAEWTYDQYRPDAYAKLPNGTAVNPVVKPTQLYPHAVRGGSWDDDPEALRSAARQGSNPRWKQRDPQVPKSDWWLTDAAFVGFRVVRPAVPPSQEEIEKYWYSVIKDL